MNQNPVDPDVSVHDAGGTSAPSPGAWSPSRHEAYESQSGAGPSWLYPFTTGYWNKPTEFREWEGRSNWSRRLRLDSSILQWGPSSLHLGMTLMPAGEAPRSASNITLFRSANERSEWGSSARLQLNLGDWGPLKDIGPFIETRSMPDPRGGRPEAEVRVGLGGKF